jgi:hypothetical protein
MKALLATGVNEQLLRFDVQQLSDMSQAREAMMEGLLLSPQ